MFVQTRVLHATKRLSGLQKEVLSLYRKLLRAANKHENPEPLKEEIRRQFKQNATIKKTSFQRIEWLVRHGHSKLDLLSRQGSKISITFMERKE